MWTSCQSEHREQVSSYRDVESRGHGVCVCVWSVLKCMVCATVGNFRVNVVQSSVTNGEYDLCSDVISPLDASDVAASLKPQAAAGSEVTLLGCHGCVSAKPKEQNFIAGKILFVFWSLDSERKSNMTA